MKHKFKIGDLIAFRSGEYGTFFGKITDVYGGNNTDLYYYSILWSINSRTARVYACSYIDYFSELHINYDNIWQSVLNESI